MTKKILGWLALVLGIFLVASGIMFATVGKSLALRTPLNVDSKTYLTGQAQKLNPATGKVDDVPVAVLSTTQVDPKKSTNDVVVFVNTTCVNIDRDNPPPCLKGSDDRLITNSTDVFAEDRHTGMAVNGSKYLPSDAVKHEGLVNKFPFDTQKKDYPYWDSLLGKTVTAKYDSSTTMDGLKVYKFTVDVPKTDAKIAGDVEGTYQTTKEMYVEPVTGAIIQQKQHEIRLLPDGSTVLNMSLEFTDKTLKSGIKDGKANVAKIKLLTTTLPIVLILVGLIAILVSVLLLRRRRTA